MTSLLLPGAAPIQHPGFRSGRYYSTWAGALGSTAAFPGGASGPLNVYPFFLASPISYTGLYARVVTGAASSNLKMGLYAHDASLHLPVGAPLVAVNTAQSSAAAGNVGAATSGNLAPGLYWAAMIGDTATGAQCVSINSSDLLSSWTLGRTTQSAAGCCALSVAQTFSSNLPTLTGAESWADVGTTGCPVLLLAT